MVKLHLNGKNLIKAVNCRVIPVAGYIMNVCVVRKGGIGELNKMVKDILREKNFHGRQASDEELCMR